MPVYTPLGLVYGDILTESRAATLETQWQLARERARPLGGIPDVGVLTASYVDVPGAVVVRIVEAVTAKVHAMGLVSAGTGYLRLYSITAAAEVAGSEDTFTDAVATLQVGADLELPPGDYKLQVRASNAANHVIVYGACLVTQ